MECIEDSAVHLLRELVAIDSVNPGLVPGAAGERTIVDFLQHRLEASGFVTTIVEAPGEVDRPSLVATPIAPTDGPTVILNGHLDTVGVQGMTDPFTSRTEGNRLFARGSADMKGGVAGIIAAAEHLVATTAPVRPVLALVADEEDASIGSAAVIDALPSLGITPDVCVIAEPTDLSICRSLRGFGIVEVRFPGVAGHSSQPELFDNAITKLGRFLRAVDERSHELKQTGADLMVTVVRGGRSPFVIPDEAECVAEMRTTPQQRGSEALVEVRNLLAEAWGASAELTLSRDGWHLDGNGPAADLATFLGRELGTSADFDAPYWMEAPMWQRACPTVICGPSGGGLHSIDEWVDLKQVRGFASGLASAVTQWAANNS